MKVKEVMTEQPAAVWITDSLASAAISMWENDCGILPILKDDRKVVGLITDRDICMATAIRRSRPIAAMCGRWRKRVGWGFIAARTAWASSNASGGGSSACASSWCERARS